MSSSSCPNTYDNFNKVPQQDGYTILADAHIDCGCCSKPNIFMKRCSVDKNGKITGKHSCVGNTSRQKIIGKQYGTLCCKRNGHCAQACWQLISVVFYSVKNNGHGDNRQQYRSNQSKNGSNKAKLHKKNKQKKSSKLSRSNRSKNDPSNSSIRKRKTQANNSQTNPYIHSGETNLHLPSLNDVFENDNIGIGNSGMGDIEKDNIDIDNIGIGNGGIGDIENYNIEKDNIENDTIDEIDNIENYNIEKDNVENDNIDDIDIDEIEKDNIDNDNIDNDSSTSDQSSKIDNELAGVESGVEESMDSAMREYDRHRLIYNHASQNVKNNSFSDDSVSDNNNKRSYINSNRNRASANKRSNNNSNRNRASANKRSNITSRKFKQ